jgi:hypothetical protein
MTTTNDGSIHPMVMKAARAYYFARWRETPEQSPEWWDACKQKLIAQMQAALTECGALECLEALEKFGKAETPADWEQAESASSSAIANVYRSAP